MIVKFMELFLLLINNDLYNHHVYMMTNDRNHTIAFEYNSSTLHVYIDTTKVISIARNC